MAKKVKVRGVFERPKDSGKFYVRYADANGRIRYKAGGSKATAKALYLHLKEQARLRKLGLAAPERKEPENPVLAEVINDYLERKQNVLRHFRHYIRLGRYWKDAFGNRRIRSITPANVETYRATRLTEASVATTNRELAFLKCVFNDAIENHLADENPVRRVKLLEENNARVRWLSDEEESRLFDALDPLGASATLLALHTGLRQEEQFKLRWEYVDLAKGIITVPRSKHGQVRYVPINDTARSVLLGLRNDTAWVFPSRKRTTTIKPDNFILRHFKPALRQAGVENFRWHDLRHTFASRLVMAGVDLRTVQDLMGHKTIAMTLRYSHLAPEHLYAAVQKLSETKTEAADLAAKKIQQNT